jgi:hypothetical protein
MVDYGPGKKAPDSGELIEVGPHGGQGGRWTSHGYREGQNHSADIQTGQQVQIQTRLKNHSLQMMQARPMQLTHKGLGY